MSKKILLIHSSVDGHTVKILDKISMIGAAPLIIPTRTVGL